jgi:hypothetical protein
MGKENGKGGVLNIPGVSRGGDFFKGKTPEMAGQLLGSRRRVEYGGTPIDLCLVRLRQAEYLNLPYLGLDEVGSKSAKFWEPRVDPSDGSVVTWRWESQKADKRDFSEYIAFAGAKVNIKFNYGQIPSGWTVGILVPQRVKGGIEAAMRQQDEISHDYGKDNGPEKARVDETFNLLYDASSAFVMGEVNSESGLNALGKSVEDHFKAHGLLESNDSIWQRVVTHTLNAAEKDRLHRVNPLVSRVRIRAAFLAGTEREMIARSVGDKAEKVYSYLAVVRAGIRLRIKLAIDMLDDVCAFSKGRIAQDPIMRERSQTYTTRQGWELVQYVKIISNNVLRGIQPAPYLKPVTAARIILAGETALKNDEERTLVFNVLDKGGYFLFMNDSAVSRLREKRLFVAEKRMRLAYDLLRQNLNDPKTTDLKVFD